MKSWNPIGVSRSLSQLRSPGIFLRLAAAVIAMVGVAAQTSSVVRAQSSGVAATEYDLKLARIYATAKFISWPDEDPESVRPFVIGVIEPDPFQGGLKKLEKRKLKKRLIRVVMMASEQDYQPCHLLFIPNDAKASVMDAIARRAANQPVLIWRDQAAPPMSTGVACSFVRQESELLIEADPAELKRRNLTPDGQLMSLNLVRMVKPNK